MGSCRRRDLKEENGSVQKSDTNLGMDYSSQLHRSTYLQ